MDGTTLLFASARFASAVARLCLGPLLPVLANQLQFPNSAKPALLSAYSSGYILTQIVGGYLADQHGFAIVTTLSVGFSALIAFYVSSLATTALQWTWSFFLLGFVAGPLFPAASTAISSNVPPKNRAASAAIIDASASAGTTVAALAPLLADSLGWRVVFQATSLCLVLVAIVAVVVFPLARPPRTQDQKQQHRTAASVSVDTKSATSIASLFLPSAVLTYLCHCADNFSKYSINSWAATMLVNKHGASQALIGATLGSQEAVGVISKALVGVWFSSIPASFRTRGLTSGFAFAAQGVALGAAFLAPNATLATVAMISSACAAGAHSVGFRPMYFEACPERAGSISGMGNTIASAASILGPIIVGSSFQGQSKNWSGVAMCMLWANFLGALSAFSIASFSSWDWKQKPEKL